MKKITLLSGLVALASVSVVFASWTFSDGTSTKDASNAIGVTVDRDIVLTGLNGTATLELNAEADGVVLTQSNIDEYGFRFNDIATDKVILAYELGENEYVHEEINATLVFDFKVDGNTRITWTVSDVLTPDGTNSYGGEYGLPFVSEAYMFSDFAADGANWFADSTMAEIDTVAELNSWLENSTFTISVSATIAI